MKFLLDVCASSRALRALLTDLGHDILSALEVDPRASDDTLLALAIQEERVLVTEDKDFGELVFVRRLPHPCIIRFVDMRVGEKIVAMRELLERHADTMRAGAIIVVTRGRVRIRLAALDNGGAASQPEPR
jgi:predicted nuclease of predicted toxin-antitoxin system